MAQKVDPLEFRPPPPKNTRHDWEALLTPGAVHRLSEGEDFGTAPTSADSFKNRLMQLAKKRGLKIAAYQEEVDGRKTLMVKCLGGDEPTEPRKPSIFA